MRTGLFLLSGLLLLGSFVILARLFSENFPSAGSWATGIFVAVWLALTTFNMWVGVSRAGYSAMEELPVLLVLFVVPTAVALILKWKFI